MNNFFANAEYVVVLLLVLCVLVIAHEWGHFIAARIFKIRVDDFSVGFGPRVFRIGKLGDTEYNIRALPLGGFVKIAGMEPDEKPLLDVRDRLSKPRSSSDIDAAELPLIAENTPTADGERDPADGFNHKPLWQRALVIFAGPAMSFIFGYLLLCTAGFVVGFPDGDHRTNQVAEVEPGGAGYAAGLRTGDRIQSIDGAAVTNGNVMVRTIQDSLGKTITITVLRHGSAVQLHATPKRRVDDRVQIVALGQLAALKLRPEDEILFVDKNLVHNADELAKYLEAHKGQSVKMVVLRNNSETLVNGVLPESPLAGVKIEGHAVGWLNFVPGVEVKHLGLAESFSQGTVALRLTMAALGDLIRRGELKKSVGGIVRTYQYTGQAVEVGAASVYLLAAQLSISLAFANLMPIPVLDGGHLLAMAIEKARSGRKFSEKEYEAFVMTGLAIIVVLFVLVNLNDILRTIHHQVPQ